MFKPEFGKILGGAHHITSLRILERKNKQRVKVFGVNKNRIIRGLKGFRNDQQVSTKKHYARDLITWYSFETKINWGLHHLNLHHPGTLCITLNFHKCL